MSERLKAQFVDLPKLNPAVVGKSDFCFPALELSKQSQALRRKREKISTSPPETDWDDMQPADLKSIDRLLAAVAKATRKLEFARTTEAQWQSSLVFSGTGVARRSSKRRYELVHASQSKWVEGEPVNITRETANDWFRRVLLHRLQEGTTNRHGQVVLGDKGCGKSTLLKYLITTNSKELKQRKLVVSRFEFMKFLKQWERRGKTRNEALLNYLSFIHARDLVLDRFFDLRDCSQYEMNFAFSKSPRQAEEISRIAIAMRRLAPVVGVRDEDDFVRMLETVLHAASLGNAELMRVLKQQSPRLRVLLVGALWEDRTVVTIFDGLDSLDVHDALQESDRWSWVKYLVENRAELSSPTELRLAGEVNDCDSILVLRRNTAAQLEFEYNKVGRSLDFESVYTVAPVDGLAATLSVTQRAAKTIVAADSNGVARTEDVTFDLMRVAQRTMIAISRNGATRVNADILYNLFAGDLREQFRFLSVIFDWSVKEMLSLGYLDTEEYFDSSPLKLIHALASTRGNDFLARKSYRVVELLLNPEGGVFENAAKVVVDASGMSGDGKPSITPVPNLAFSGHFDNVFNYLDRSESETIDHHSFLKKLRALQLLSEGDMSFSQFSSRMEKTFGYSPVGAKDVVLFLLQTEFASAHVVYRSGIYDILLSSSAKGALCIKSLVFNLAYLENVFHCTLFPSVLVSHISDKERSISVTDWAAVSIRNAFIFLSYFALIENNDAYGKPVPQRYRLLSEMREKIIATVVRIVESRGTSDRVDVDSERIAARSLDLIKKTREQWRMARVLL